MKTFIKVIEIWIPDRERTELEFGSGLYGNLTDFQAISERQSFAYDEGLPGKAWAAGHPIVLSRFEDSYFKRTAAAQKAGLTCGIAIPIFAGEFLLAVVVFICGDDREQAGAIEVWRNDEGEESPLRVLDGYYGALQGFESVSRETAFDKGEGIAGMAWLSGMPVLLEDIGAQPGFYRADAAKAAGVATAVAIPFIHGDGQTYVISFLSANATPIAKRIQIWVPNDESGRLTCRQSYSNKSNDLAEIFEMLMIEKGVGALGRVWLTGMPSISGGQDDSYSDELEDLSQMLAIPVIEQGRLKAIVSFLF